MNKIKKKKKNKKKKGGMVQYDQQERIEVKVTIMNSDI